MNKKRFSVVVSLGLSITTPTWAEPPAQNQPAKERAVEKAQKKPAQPGPSGDRPAAPQGRGLGGPVGPVGHGPGQTGPGPRTVAGAGLTPEQAAERAKNMKERMASHAERLAARSQELREKAKQARANGDDRQAEQLEKAAERLEKRPLTPERGEGWKKAMERRKRARLKPLWKQYGERLKEPEVQEEFKKHAVRVARLDRMRALARGNADEEARKSLLERINASMAKENARHRQTLRAMMANKEQAETAKQENDSPDKQGGEQGGATEQQSAEEAK